MTKKTLAKIVIFITALSLPLLVFGYVFGFSNLNFLNPVKIASDLSSPKLKSDDGRINILILGIDKRMSGNTVTSVLTDTILVASIGLTDNKMTLISLPRDLWVTSSLGISGKINSVYGQYDSKTKDLLGSSGTKEVVSEVLGIPIHYNVTINFEVFKKIIDTLGGVEVEIENSFTDSEYPIEGKENDPVISNRYETVTFNKGIEKMDGERALKYVRSRHGNGVEGTDFARSKRQQKVILAIKDKLMSPSFVIDLPKIKELFSLYEKEVETNIKSEDLISFFSLYKRLNLTDFTKVVLDDRSSADEGGLLISPENRDAYGGAYVLIPRVGDFSQIQAYVRKFLFE
jgi:LCP family protein required for cell wall assembly